jgi:acetyl-CoA acetyltransferase
MAVVDKATKEVSYKDITLSQDEGPRPETTAEGLASLKSVREGGSITAGNASQLSDGASATVIMSDKEAAKRGLKPLGIFRGFVAAGCEPMKWASVRCSRFRVCFSVTASRSMTSTCGS